MSNIHDPILQKRNDLEQFIEEQIIGPGAFNKRLMFLEDWETNSFKGKVLTHCRALENLHEVIGELPAYQYSSGILFPTSITAEEAAAQDNDANVPDGEDETNEGALPKADDEEFFGDQEQSTSSKNQNYPNTCGLSFATCFGTALEQDFSLRVMFRQYHKVRQHDCQQRRLGLWIERYDERITTVINDYFNGIFETIKIDGNTFIALIQGVDINQHLYSLDYINLDRLLRDTVIPLIEIQFPDKDLFQSVLKTYGGVEYDTFTLYDSSLLDEIQKIILSDKSRFNQLQALIENFEIYQQVKQYINDLKAIYRSSSRRNFPTPIWESHFYDIPVILPAFTELLVQRGEIPVNGFPNLWLNYQYLKDNGIIYIKVILVNRETIKLRPNEPEQLNKKDRANELAYFGVRIVVSEKTAGSFTAYNPPNLLTIDEEDNFNKLLYRKFKDYGEGYNTSVSWGTLATTNLRYVCTEFVPRQDTPSVDFRPSKIEGDSSVALIDDSLLSIRGLSTLTARTNEDILLDLSKIVSAYKEWIDNRSQDLEQETDVFQGGDLLRKQLKSCEQDHNRLARNIELLRNDQKGLAAFRTMNTAMFMQIHHSSMIKISKNGDKLPFVPSEKGANFYQNIILEKEYAWRSFQLAFILLNVDAFIRPDRNDLTIPDIFETGWPERNELADLVWFPTGGGKTEAYLGIIAFAIAYRRFTHGDDMGKGTTVLMRYTLRLLTLQQFQRASLLICALETIRKDGFAIPNRFNLGSARITIGLFVGSKSLPNNWDEMRELLNNVSEQVKDGKPITTSLPHTECPWCGGALFTTVGLPNVEPMKDDRYGINDKLTIMCNTNGCTFNAARPDEDESLPFRLFDDDIYKFPPTLLFGTVDKFAALANKVSTTSQGRSKDSRRLLGKGNGYRCYPPDLIIQDELHLLLGPLGSAVGLFEKSIDELCSYEFNGIKVRPKVITSTATTRNTDKQIFALFDRRCEIFPKQGITSDDSFFSFYKRQEDNVHDYASNRRYIGLLPVGKTQVWMQLRIASICLAHRVKFMLERFTYDEIFYESEIYKNYQTTFNYYHTVLSYFNSLKEVGKTQSQLSHYLPGDLNLIIKNVISWSVLNRIIKRKVEINESELTGRLSGEEVKSNLASIESVWELTKVTLPPEFVIATNMISVGIDVARFNTMIINSMPRNTAEYIQASSRVARDREGIVFTVHHPFRSRDISHYERFREFHEKFYSYVEPISVTPFANKALDRYFAMYLAVIIRHNDQLGLANNEDAKDINALKIDIIRQTVSTYIRDIYQRSLKLNEYLKHRPIGTTSSVEGIITEEEIADIGIQLNDLLISRWLERTGGQDPALDIKYRDRASESSLFPPPNNEPIDENWNVKQSLREIAPSVVIKTVQQ